MFKFVVCLAFGAEFTEAARVAVNEHKEVASTMEEVQDDDESATSSTWTPVFPELARGGNDGSCPAGTTRVSSENCRNLNGWGMDRETLSNRRFRVDCARHFTPGEGCFFNTNNDVYATGPDCASAAGVPGHWAVCEQNLVKGTREGVCPVGTYRLDAQRCPRTSGHMIDGTVMSDGLHRVDCRSHFMAGPGCFVNTLGNVYSTGPECSVALTNTNPNTNPVCVAGRLVRGGTDGSCPSLTTRVTAQDCPNVNGLSLRGESSVLSSGAFRVDCAQHFTPGEGCFVNDRGNVYATAPECASAEARGGIAIHHAVCVAFDGISL